MVDELRLYFGKNADYYIRAYKKWVLKKRAGWNWAAFFFTTAWFGYRKMWLEGLKWTAGVILGYIVVAILHAHLLAPFVMLVAAIIAGARGNEWYIRKACKEVEELKQQGVSKDMIALKGGTALGLGFLYAFLLAFLIGIGQGIWRTVLINDVMKTVDRVTYEQQIPYATVERR